MAGVRRGGKKNRKWGRQADSPSFKKYVRLHPPDEGKKKIRKRPGYQRAKSLRTVLHEVADATRVTAEMEERVRPDALHRNRVYIEHAQRVRGLLTRYARQHRMSMRAPRIAETGRCGKRECAVCKRTV